MSRSTCVNLRKHKKTRPCSGLAIDWSVSDVWQQSHLTSTLYSDSKLTLILSAGSRDPARNDLAVGGNELLQKLNILIVDIGDVILGEIAYLAATHSLFLECHGLLSFFFSERQIVARDIETRTCVEAIRSGRLRTSIGRSMVHPASVRILRLITVVSVSVAAGITSGLACIL